MVKILGKFTRPEELLNKLADENVALKNENKRLNEELELKNKEIDQLENLIKGYQEYFNEDCEDHPIEDDLVTYEEWFNSEASQDLINAYAEMM